MIVVARRNRREKKRQEIVEEQDDITSYMPIIKGNTTGKVNLSKMNLCDIGARCVADYYLAPSSPFQNSFCALTALILQWNDIWVDGARAIGKLLSHDASSILFLDLGHNNIGSNGVYHIAESLKGNKKIKTLELNDNGIDDGGATHLIGAFDYCHTLCHVGLTFNLIRDRSITDNITRLAAENAARVKLQEKATVDDNQQVEVERQKVIDLTTKLNRQLTQSQGREERLLQQYTQSQDQLTTCKNQLKNAREIEQQLRAEKLSLQSEFRNGPTHEEVAMWHKKCDRLHSENTELRTYQALWHSERTELLNTQHHLTAKLDRFDEAKMTEMDIAALSLLEDELEHILKSVRSIKVQKLQRRSEDCLNESRKCKVCFEHPINTLLFPCAHLVLCQECSGKVQKCPLCNKAIENRVRVFEG